MNYKLMAVDVDGTLLRSDGTISPHQKDTIKKAIEKGLIFAICSGRPVQGAKKIAELLDEDLPLITYNGGLVITGKSKKVLFEKKLSREQSIKIVDIGRKVESTIVVWVDHVLYVSPLNESARKYAAIGGVDPVEFDHIEDIIGDGAHKVLFVDTKERIKEIAEEYDYLHEEGINLHPSKPEFLEFVDESVTKSNGIMHLGQRYGITMDQVIAAGDSYNDLSMLQDAGLSVVMDNAPEDVKEHGDYITSSNNEDGIAKVIEKFIL